MSGVDQSAPKRRGGARAGAGRPREMQTSVVRIPSAMVEAVKIMAQATKDGHFVEYRIIPKS